MKYIAHRGFSSKYEENSKKAFIKAFKFPIDMIEADLRLTEDNVWVIIHDSTLSRLRKIKKWVNKVKSNLLRKKGFMTINEFLGILKSNIEVYLDIKGHPTIDQLSDLLSILYKSGWQLRKFYLASFNPDVVQNLIFLRTTYPKPNEIPKKNHIKIGIIGHPRSILSHKDDIIVEADFVSIYYDDLSNEYFQMLRKKSSNLQIYVFTLNDLFTIQHFQNMGVDGLLSDNSKLFTKLN